MAFFIAAPLLTKLAIGSLALAAASVGLQAISAREQVKASNKAAEYNAKIAERNADISELQAVSAERRGAVAEKQHRMRIARLKGSQRVSAAASGVVVDQGSPLQVLEDTELFGELDAMTIRANAAQEAWGFRTQAGDFVSRARLSRLKKGSPGLAFGTSLLSGASQLGSRYVGFKERGVL